ncbi:LuxR C-terminal-related transcriptional regulator [Ktedonospora formicarum]|uniref:LuxR family transcriptional regulator n=1 Tax=Ktedonospora formicarum TaxID=2778364 RepID=A0A8J3IEC6_9CHLR|nr:LuxR C-terminal-related transcriptional regulator [Ktedonospora formicarum]GHO49734.1 LuxR family transcriptional regulator [Ktedonospora formicarum]
MPKSPDALLTWSSERHAYQLQTADHVLMWIRLGTEESWFAWLTAQTSFSFQGQCGQLNVYKESRARGTGYWYAYHTRSGQTRKRYLGHSRTVTLARLEEVAQKLQEIEQERLQHLSLVSTSLARTQSGNKTLSSLVELGSEFHDPNIMMITRLSPPRLPVSLVVRERLLTALDTALSHPLTLLSAAAGWGKTTLISAWAQRHHEAVAWLSLEPLDNDPTRFWISLIAALRRRWPALGEQALTQMRARSPLASCVTILLNELAERTSEVSPILLILDDYHVVDEPTIHASLSLFLAHLPSHVHLVLSSRVDPDFPLARLRARGHLFEIRNTDLRFTQEEAQSFLIRRMGIALSERDVALLEARTEGWIAGLQLAALVLQKQADPSASAQTFNGSQRFLLDYLREEVFASFPDELQNFLLQTSGLPCLSASLCNAITGREDNDLLLEQVERANLFLQSLDESQQWYRYHALWAQALQHEARRRLGTTVVNELRSKASQWYEHQQMLPEAIEAALAAEDFVRAATLIQQFLAPNSFQNEFHLLRSWLLRLPEEVLRTQPDLCFWYVLTTMFTVDRRDPAIQERSERCIQWAEQGFQAREQWEQLGEALQLHGELLFYYEDLTNWYRLASQAQPLIGERSFLYPDNLLSSGYGALLAGEVERARQSFLQALEISKRINSLVAVFAALVFLGDVSLEQGELQRAAHTYTQALAFVEQDQKLSQQQFLATGGLDPFYTSWAFHSLAQLCYERNELARAQDYLAQAQALRAQPEDGIHVNASGAFVQARLLHAYGKTIQAQELLLQWERHARVPLSADVIHALLARLRLSLGELHTVEQWIQAREHASGSQAAEQGPSLLKEQGEALLLARWYIAQREGEIALKALAPWKEKAQAQGRKRSVLEIQILEALAHVACQEHSQARSSLLQALKLAQPQNYQRVFLDEGSAMEALLRTLLPELRETSLLPFAHFLLRGFAQDVLVDPPQKVSRKDTLLLEPLSQQELRVLRLLVAGRSNPEIASELIISLNTVKTHIQSLYRKLDVHNRMEASETARRLSLL